MAIGVIPSSIGTDGEVYYRCPRCGAVGNWPDFIVDGKCHTLIVSFADIASDKRSGSRIVHGGGSIAREDVSKD